VSGRKSFRAIDWFSTNIDGAFPLDIEGEPYEFAWSEGLSDGCMTSRQPDLPRLLSQRRSQVLCRTAV
jgi:hypothetical protein